MNEYFYLALLSLTRSLFNGCNVVNLIIPIPGDTIDHIYIETGPSYVSISDQSLGISLNDMGNVDHALATARS